MKLPVDEVLAPTSAQSSSDGCILYHGGDKYMPQNNKQRFIRSVVISVLWHYEINLNAFLKKKIILSSVSSIAISKIIN